MASNLAGVLLIFGTLVASAGMLLSQIFEDLLIRKGFISTSCFCGNQSFKIIFGSPFYLLYLGLVYLVKYFANPVAKPLTKKVFWKLKSMLSCILSFVPFLVSLVVSLGVRCCSTLFFSHLFGKELRMKRKLVVASLWMVVGFLAPNLYSGLKGWYDAPPTPPGTEAQSIVQSLDSASGWSVTLRGNAVWLTKGNTAVKPCSWKADVEVNSADANSNFSSADLGAINDAAKHCLRQLTVQGLANKKSDDSKANASNTNGVVKEEGEFYIVNLPNGATVKVGK